MLMELYRIITGHENYEVSNLGNVRNKKNGNLLTGSMDHGGYRLVSLNSLQHRVHRLVAIAFIKNPLDKPIVDHINNVRDDNRVCNLRWATNPNNGGNQKLSKNNTSGFKGVRYSMESEMYCVNFPYNEELNQSRSCECFYRIDDAIIYRVEQMILRYGEFVNVCELTALEEAKVRRDISLNYLTPMRCNVNLTYYKGIDIYHKPEAPYRKPFSLRCHKGV